MMKSESAEILLPPIVTPFLEILCLFEMCKITYLRPSTAARSMDWLESDRTLS
jgi:hypothetical protein